MDYIEFRIVLKQGMDLYNVLYKNEPQSNTKHASKFLLEYIHDFKRHTNITIVDEDFEVIEKLKGEAAKWAY